MKKQDGDLLQKLADSAAYNHDVKDSFHRKGLKVLRAFGKTLGLESDEYEVRSNKGGMAVAGEITFHCDFLYVQISSSSVGLPSIMYRACNGRKDYSGLQNNFAKMEVLNDLDKFSKRFIESPNFFQGVKEQYKARIQALNLSNSAIETQPAKTFKL